MNKVGKNYLRRLTLVACSSCIAFFVIAMQFSINTWAESEVDAKNQKLTSSGAVERGKAAKELGEMGEAALKAVPNLLKMLNDSVPLSVAIRTESGIQVEPDTSPGIEAAKALVKIGDSSALVEANEIFIRTLEDKRKPTNTRANAATALGWIGNKKAVEPLITALKDSEDHVRRAAAFAFIKIKDERAVEPLVTALRDKDERVRKRAASALGSMGDPRGVEPLIAALEREDPDKGIRSVNDWSGSMASLLDAAKNFREYVAEALGKIKDPRAVSPLTKALNDSDEGVRKAAAWSLGEIRDQRAVEPLKTALKDKDEKVRKEAESALRKIRGTSPE